LELKQEFDYKDFAYKQFELKGMKNKWYQHHHEDMKIVEMMKMLFQGHFLILLESTRKKYYNLRSFEWK
jgi:hypothetical protein